jgi:hypothetical protein
MDGVLEALELAAVTMMLYSAPVLSPRTTAYPVRMKALDATFVDRSQRCISIEPPARQAVTVYAATGELPAA